MDNAPIVFICGLAGSGKDTAGKLIQETMPNTGSIALAAPIKELGSKLFQFTDDQLHGPSEFRNAPDPRFDSHSGWDQIWRNLNQGIHSEWLNKYFDNVSPNSLEEWVIGLRNITFSINKPLTPRLMLQQLGTEFGRKIDPDVWVKIGLQTCKNKLVSGESDLMVVTDCRFKNEVICAKSNNATVVLIQCPEVSGQGGIYNHASEADVKTMPFYWYDEVIINLKEKGLDHFKAVMQNFCERNFRTVL